MTSAGLNTSQNAQQVTRSFERSVDPQSDRYLRRFLQKVSNRSRPVHDILVPHQHRWLLILQKGPQLPEAAEPLNEAGLGNLCT